MDAVDEFIIDDEDVNAIFFDASGQLFWGGTDIEQVDPGSDVTLGTERDNDAAAVAGHDAEPDFWQL